MKTRIIVLASVILQSCGVTGSMEGKYASGTIPSCFQFNKDSTYIYEFRKFHVYEYSTGRWTKSGKNKVVLNSDRKSVVVPMTVVESGCKQANKSVLSFNLNIKGKLQLADYGCEVYVNGNFFCLRRCDSLSVLSLNSVVKNVCLKFTKTPLTILSTLISLPLSTDIYYPKKKGCTNLSISIAFSDSLFSYRPFINEVIKVHKNYLKYYYDNKWQEIPKLTNDSNIFVNY